MPRAPRPARPASERAPPMARPMTPGRYEPARPVRPILLDPAAMLMARPPRQNRPPRPLVQLRRARGEKFRPDRKSSRRGSGRRRSRAGSRRDLSPGSRRRARPRRESAGAAQCSLEILVVELIDLVELVALVVFLDIARVYRGHRCPHWTCALELPIVADEHRGVGIVVRRVGGEICSVELRAELRDGRGHRLT